MADSPHAQSLKSRAKLLAARGELREALEAYEAALRVDPDDPVSHLRVAEMYQSLEHEAAAISAYLNAARAWTRAGELLRAVAALVMARVPGTRFDVVHTVAERFALPPGALAPTFAWVPDGKDPGVPVLASVGREAFVALVEALEVRERSVLLEFKRQSLARVSAAHPEVDAAVHAFYQRRLVENLLRTSPLFTNLPPALKQAMSREFDLRAVPAGEVLLTQGQPGDAFYLLLRGQVQLSLEQRGRIVLLPELREGDVFGEISLLLDKPVSATVRTRTPCVVLRLERAAFERHVVTQPGLKGQLMRMGTERLQQTAKALFV
ncbi:tetratricopeptide repeat protein [Corallococcus sp. AB049A]|uniref:cyclic nucleotide-binding domain-containing protein n=1 Tax=Corallococcus sp. AB049A TaxID=2316721 RepID=UPI000EBA3EEA|nr:cyclic nucleotide-binding domain-containing protein [Corallococcus sp. AB049A]RKI54040.1 tetratricopeptide repeat protein [Corallococcus sp. AB049A]